ncbi:alpha/beta fold hydrolase [Zobellia alginiliquefaciens]|uniref:alpha/beta fold hydrolase n=1 Tax=Zobellia alginiliquefaciens TaxID=3032586 RepID=UPI0023E31398|nr:alpha/beta hydrolase [Zobellia alginiliquefaciens]
MGLLVMLICFISCKEKKPEKQNSVPDPDKTELKTVLINGSSLNYLDIGKGEPVVFVHGTVGDYRVWEAQMYAFAKNHRVIAYSRRFAYPNKQVLNDSADFSVTAHSKDLTTFIQELNLGPVHLVGHSFGAFTSLVTALEHPELLQSLTLREPPIMSLLQNIPKGEELLNDFVGNVLIPAGEEFAKKNDEKAVEIFIGGVLEDSLYFSKAAQKEKDLMLDNILELRASVTRKNLLPPLACDDIKTIKMPVLLMKGDKSPEVLTAILEELHSCIGHSEFVILSNSSHGLAYENPVEFNKIVLDFINKN